LPEHSLVGTAMAYSWGVDYIEPDLVLTKDDEVIVLHDIHLDTTTDVAKKFPKRKRKDGRFYAIDFTLSEIKTLQLHERRSLTTKKAVFPGRYPVKMGGLRVPSFKEQLVLIQGLDKSRGGTMGLYPEIKHPEFHMAEGKDITKIVWNLLTRFGYTKKGSKIFIQCFSDKPLKRLRKEFQCKVPLIQLIGVNSWKESSVDYKAMRTEKGLKAISKYADGVGLWLGHCAAVKKGAFASSGLVKGAHAAGLKVHVYTARADSLPKGVDSFDTLLSLLVHRLKVDGIFSDHGDKAMAYVKGRGF
ncbi:MAG: glycerophosphodiester phosphodiesterase, partial [Planctomycetota bacterium]|nr:glycerophosphodiester phosphodiesterase [Planctomycetota bacterium]